MKVMWYLDIDCVRKVCVDNSFYTHGSCEEYSDMFSKLNGKESGLTFEEVTEIAEDIAAHSGEDITVEFVAGRLLNAAYTIVK